MNLDLSNRNATATIIGSACLFAAAFWLLDAGSVLWRSNSGFFSAILPEGTQFLIRLLYASIFAVAGSIAGAAVQRVRDIEEFAIDQLTDSESKYRALLASSFDSVMILGNDARIIELNDSAATLFGSSTRAMIGTTIDDFVETAAGMSPRRGELFSELIGQHADNQGSALPVRARAAQGRQFPADVRVTTMPGTSASAYLVSIRETTSTVVAQKALRHSERRYQSLLDNITDGVYRSLPDGRLLAGNPALVEMLGYETLQELIERGNTRDFYHDPQERTNLMTQLESSGEARNVEIQLRRCDGSKLTALANVRAIVSENNEDVVYEGTLTDISNLLEARNALLDSEEHFRTLFEHSLDVINVINEKGEIIYSSPSSKQFTRRAPGEQVGLGIFRSVHRDDLAEVGKIIAAGFARPGEPQHFTCRVYRDDGSFHYIDAVGTAFMTRHGELRAVIQSRDVTNQMQAEAELRDQQKLDVVGRLAEGLTHEFNDVLTAMSGNLELLDDRIADIALKSRVAAAMEACQRGSDITRRIMAFRNNGEARAEIVQVNAVMQSLEQVIRRSVSDGTTIESDLDEDLWAVNVDPVQFEAAVLQLIANAGEAMRGNRGLLTIRTSNHWFGDADDKSDDVPAMDCVSISFRDNGNGMSNEVLARATDPFFSGSEHSGHAGLGLYAVRKFVEGAGGELKIASTPDIGTMVRIFLPRCDQEISNSDSAEAVPRGDEQVLLVDPIASVRKATAALLTNIGYCVREASDGPMAMQMLQDSNVDLLIAESRMTPVSGLALAVQVGETHPNTKVLLMSGSDAAAAEDNENLNTAYELIRKPFRRQRLAEQVRLVLET